MTLRIPNGMAEGSLFYPPINRGGLHRTDQRDGGVAPPSPTDQGAIELTGHTEGAELLYQLAGNGQVNFVLETLIYVRGRDSTAALFGVRNAANARTINVQCNNSFPNYPICLGDSETGTVGSVFDPQPDLDTWGLMTIQSPNLVGSSGGIIHATWRTLADPTTIVSVSRTNGIPSSVPGTAVWIGGLARGDGAPAGVRFQHVRGRLGYLSDEIVDSNERSISDWDFWWEFREVNGEPTVVDLTGNNRVPTITGGVITAGPVMLSPT